MTARPGRGEWSGEQIIKGVRDAKGCDGRGRRWGRGVGMCRKRQARRVLSVSPFSPARSGLNSAHIMFANDGLIPDSTGSEPPLFRWQPKMNFDISL